MNPIAYLITSLYLLLKWVLWVGFVPFKKPAELLNGDTWGMDVNTMGNNGSVVLPSTLKTSCP